MRNSITVIQAYRRIHGDEVPAILHTPVRIIDRTNMSDPQLQEMLHPRSAGN